MRMEMDRRSMGMLAAGHLFNDIHQGAVPALLPFLVAQRGLSYAAVAGLVLAATVSSSVVQPLFGHISDRHPLPWLMPTGIALAGVGIALTGWAPTYPLLFLSIVLSGLGVAAFHPEASRFANYVSGRKRASGMSVFSLGGNAGFAVGPIALTPLLLAFGLKGTLFMIVPAAAMALVLLRELPRLNTFRPAVTAGSAAYDAVPAAWGAFSRLTGAIAARSLIYFGLMTFVPLYYVEALNASRGAANTALTVMLVGGAVGTLIGGPLADRFGRRGVLIGSMAVLPPLILILTAVGPGVGLVILALIGAATVATFSVTVVMGQEYLPGRIGMASGVTLGLSIGLGGIGASLLGIVADHYGLRTTLETMAALPIVAIALALTLPRPVPPRVVAQPAQTAQTAQLAPVRAAARSAT